MPYLAYAAGLIGIYQADLTIPEDTADGKATLFCSVSDSSGGTSTGAFLNTTSLP